MTLTSDQIEDVQNRLHKTSLPEHWSAMERVAYWTGLDAAFEALQAELRP